MGERGHQWGRLSMWALLVGLAAMNGSTAYAELYSYVDEQGVLHLTNLSPAARRAQKTRVSRAASDGFGGLRPVLLAIEGRERVVYPVNVTRFDPIFRQAAEHYRLPFALIKAVAKVESNFNPQAVSSASAKGLMQLMDATAADMKVREPFDPEQNIFGGARYLRHLANVFEGDLVKTTAAYNAGPERVLRVGGVPNIRETQRYVRRVLLMYRHYRLQESTRP